MEKSRLLLVGLVFAFLFAACGGPRSSFQSPSQSVTVTLSPSSATVDTGATYQFTAKVVNTDDHSVDWQVNGIAGGNSTVGTISTSGLYTAPGRVPSSSSSVKITAVSHADPTKSASASVTVWGAGTVSVSPSQVTVPAGATQVFSASIMGDSGGAYDWAVNGVNGGNAEVGTILGSGTATSGSETYTAPRLPPPGGTITITATRTCLCDDPATGTASATVVFSNASLSGPYVFSFSGNDPGGPVYRAGRFVADGNGNITEGVSDVQHAGGASAQESFTGTYAIQPDGRGTLALTVEGSQQPANYSFELSATGGGALVRFDNAARGSGEFYKQDSAAFSDASLNGSYAFQSLAASSSGTLGAAGVFAGDGAGDITGGMEDVNDGQNVESKMPVTGSYSVDSTGRVTATINASGSTGSMTSQLAMYLVSGDRAVFVNTDNTGAAGVGVAEKQQTASFSNSALSGDFVYMSTGEPATEGNFSLGRLTADGSGGISAGVLDQNDGGTVNQAVSFTGAYSIPATDQGRGTASLTTSNGTVNFIFYVVSDKKAFVVSADTSSVEGGQLLAQEPFSNSSFQGNFAFSLRGFDTLGEVDVVGGFGADGSGSLKGTEDVNDAGTLSSKVLLTGTYSVGQDGRGQVTVTAGGIVSAYDIYVADSANAFLIGTDSSQAVFGSTAKQF